MFTSLLLILISLVDSYTSITSINAQRAIKQTLLLLFIVSSGTNANRPLSSKEIIPNAPHPNHRITLNALPPGLLEEHLFPFLSADDAQNLMSSQYDHIKSILKIWNPKRRLRQLKEELENVDPAFEHNYLLRYAAAKGMKDVVELLLKYPSVDPTARDSWALILAKENGHNDVYELLMQHVDQGDIESGIVPRVNSSHALLSDIIHDGSLDPWKDSQQKNDLELLLDTSTKLLPYLENAMREAIHLGKTDLVKMMLFFVAFDKSYFNHKVLIRQFAAGNSIKDIRKINPFTDHDASLLISAIKNGNAELANLILGKALKWNPFQLYMCTKYYSRRWRTLNLAHIMVSEILESNSQPDLETLELRLKSILENQSIYQAFVFSSLITGSIGGFFGWLSNAVSRQ